MNSPNSLFVMNNKTRRNNFLLTILMIGAMVAMLLLESCASKKNLSTEIPKEQNYLIPFVADSAMSQYLVDGRTFYTDSTLIDLRSGSNRFVIDYKTACFLDTIITKGFVNGKEVVMKGYIATFANGKQLFYMVQDKTMMPLLTPLFNHPDSVMIDSWSMSKKKEIWDLFGGKGSRLFYDPNEVITITSPGTPVTVKTIEGVTTPEMARAPIIFVTDTIRGVDYKQKLVKPKKN